jgi:integrase
MPPPLIRPYSEKDVPYVAIVYFDGPGGARRRRKFLVQKEARAFFTDKEVEYDNLGRTIASEVDDDLKRDAHTANRLLKEFGVTLHQAAAHYRQHLLVTAKSAPIRGLVEEFLAKKRALGRSACHVSDLGCRLKRLVKKFGDRFASDIGTEEIDGWLTSMTDLSNATRNHYRSKVYSFFAWCVRMRKCQVNPVQAIEKAEEPPRTCEIYSANELRTMLGAAVAWHPERIKKEGRRGRNCLKFDHRTDDILANIVLCAFAGLRQSEFQRLTWEMVKVDRAIIDLPPEITKKRRRRMVKIQPTLAAWLIAHFPSRIGPIMKPNFLNRLKAFKRHLIEQHRLTWRHNGLRHSFASHLLEVTRKPGDVAMELGHRGDVGVLWDHYAERVGEEDAASYWALTPDAVVESEAAVLRFQTAALA